MKKILLFIVLLSIACTSSRLLKKTHSDKEILKHVSFVLESLQNQGFSGVIGKAKESKIFVPVKINGIPDDFFIDTGATYTFLSQNHISKYHLKKINTVDKKASIATWFGSISNHERAVANAFELGNHRFSPWPFIIHQGSGKPVLGTDFLHFTNTVLICRYSALLFTIKHKKAIGLSDSLREFGYKEFDLILSEGGSLGTILNTDSIKVDIGTFLIRASFNGIEGMILIDTGAQFTTIDHQLAEMTGRRIRKQDKIYFIDALGNESYPSVIFADSLKIGNYLLSEKQFFPIFQNVNASGSYSLPYLGAIGMDYLTKNNAIIDYGNHKLYMIQ